MRVGGTDCGRGHRVGARADLDCRRDLRTRDAQTGRRRQPEGPVPFPRREVAVVQRHPGAWFLPLLRLRRRRRLDQLRDGDRPPVVRRGRRAAGRPGRGAASLSGGRAGAGPPDRPAAAAGRRARRGGPLLRRPARLAGCPGGPGVPGPARIRPRRRRAVWMRLRPRRMGSADPTPAAEGLHRRGAGDRRAGAGGAVREPDRPVPPPAALADPGDLRRCDRIRRAQAVRRRRRSEIPQHPRDADLQEIPCPVRDRPGQTRDRQAGPGGDRRGVHRRDGLPSRRGADRRGDLRHLVRR